MKIIITTTYEIPSAEILRQNMCTPDETYEDMVDWLMDNTDAIYDCVGNKKETIELIKD